MIVPAKLKIVATAGPVPWQRRSLVPIGSSPNRDLASGDTVDHFVDGPVATGGDDFSKSLSAAAAGPALSASPRVRRRVNDDTASDRFNPLLPVFRLAVTCRRVENDDVYLLTRTEEATGFDLFFKLWLRNVFGVQKLRRLALLALRRRVFALGAIALIGVNLYVQSQGTQATDSAGIKPPAGNNVGDPQMSVTPWGGLELSGITIPQTSPVGTSHFLEARTFRLRVRFLSLFSRRLVIKDVSLVNPNVVWAQNAEGKWRLPGARKKKRRWLRQIRLQISPSREHRGTGRTGGASRRRRHASSASITTSSNRK